MKTITDQIQELQVHFDNPFISCIADVDKLSPYEFFRIKVLIKKLKEDDIYIVSDKVSLQLVFGEVIILNKKEDARRVD